VTDKCYYQKEILAISTNVSIFEENNAGKCIIRQVDRNQIKERIKKYSFGV